MDVPKFLVEAVPSVGSNDDGTALLVRVRSGTGEELDIIASAASYIEIMNALAEAANQAAEARRRAGKIDPGLPMADIEPLDMVGFRFAVGEQRRGLLLEVHTQNGRTDIRIPAAMAVEFGAAAAKNVDWLVNTPPKSGAN